MRFKARPFCVLTTMPVLTKYGSILFSIVSIDSPVMLEIFLIPKGFPVLALRILIYFRSLSSKPFESALIFKNIVYINILKTILKIKNIISIPLHSCIKNSGSTLASFCYLQSIFFTYG